MAANWKTGYKFMELVFMLTLQVLFRDGEAKGFIIAKSCRKEIGQVDPITFPPGRAVWMQVVSAPFLVLGHGVASSTSGEILRSSITNGGSCDVTPFKTMQVITSPYSKVQLKDPVSKKFICSIANAELTLREGTGYISCEMDMGPAEMEIKDLIKATDFFSSILMNEAPIPAANDSTIGETSKGSVTAQIREKRKLQHFATTENLLHSVSSLYPQNATSNSSGTDSIATKASETITKPYISETTHFYATPQPILMTRETSQAFESNTSEAYVTKETESRPIPQPSLFDRELPERSRTISFSSSVNSELMNYIQSIEMSSVDISPTSSLEEISLESTSVLPDGLIVTFESILESTDVESDEYSGDYITESFMGAITTMTAQQSAHLVSLPESILVFVSGNEMHPSIFSSASALDVDNAYDFADEDDAQAYVITPTPTLEERKTSVVSASTQSSSYQKEKSLAKTSRPPVKVYATNEDIQNKIMGFFSLLTNYFKPDKETSLQEQNFTSVLEVTPTPFINHTLKGELDSDEINAFSTHTPFLSSSITLNDLTKPKTSILEQDTSLVAISGPIKSLLPNNYSHPEATRNEVPGKIAILPNEVIAYISSKSDNREKGLNDSKVRPTNEEESSFLLEVHPPLETLPKSISSSDALNDGTRLTTMLESPSEAGKPVSGNVDVLGVKEGNSSDGSPETRNYTWLLFVGGAIALQIQLVLGLTIIWCCIQRRFKRYVDTESPATIYDGFSKVVNFRNSEKLADETDRPSSLDNEENENDSTSKAALEIPKCLTTSL